MIISAYARDNLENQWHIMEVFICELPSWVPTKTSAAAITIAVVWSTLLLNGF